jgi:hypothetical protein
MEIDRLRERMKISGCNNFDGEKWMERADGERWMERV